jgi:hypothetical protein
MSIAMPAATITSANAAMSIGPGTKAPSRPPANAVAIDAIPNASPVRHRTCPARACETSATLLVTPTTNSDAPIASCTPSPSA